MQHEFVVLCCIGIRNQVNPVKIITKEKKQITL